MGFAVFVMADLVESRVLAFDVGGSHVASAVCSGSNFRLGPIASAPHSATHTSDAFVDLLFQLGTKARTGLGEIDGHDQISGAMLAVPGPFDLQAGVRLLRA